MLRWAMPVLALAAAAVPALAQDPASDPLAPRRIFDAEICEVDGLTPAQCDCAWQLVQARFAPPDLRLAMLLTATASENGQLARRASDALASAKLPQRRRDDLQASVSALTVEAEDRCSR
jgi:hypothetical protein